MNWTRSDYAEKIKKAIEDVVGGGVEVELTHPTVPEHGDYATNVALVAFGDSKWRIANGKWKSPLEFAEYIKIQLSKNDLLQAICERIEVAPPGFINFTIKKEVLLDSLMQSVNDEQFGESKLWEGKKIIIEYTDPNPFKEFHVGHLFTNAVGESLARLFESQGPEVKRANYQGDVGLHVEKAIYGILWNGKWRIEDVKNEPLDVRTKHLGEAYALGAKAYEEDQAAKEEIIALNKKVYDLDPEIKELYETGRKWSLDAFEQIYKRLDTRFDFYYFERDTGRVGEVLVKEHLKDGVFEESNGAIIFPGEKHGLHNRVFINSQGLPTYEAKDLGLAQTKYKDFPYTHSYIVTGNEIKEYFKVIIAALGSVDPELGRKVKHVAHGMVRLPTGKMSSRAGGVIGGESLLDEAKKRLLQAYPEMDEETAEKVGVGAVKYTLLKSAIGTDIIFDFDKSLSFEGDSGPYLQYTYARTQSVLEKSTDYGLPSTAVDGRRLTVDMSQEELALLRTFYKFPEVVSAAAENLAPNLVATYVIDLAQKYNAFYNKHRILEAEGGQKDLRLVLTEVVGTILRNGLGLLGIFAPEKM